MHNKRFKFLNYLLLLLAIPLSSQAEGFLSSLKFGSSDEPLRVEEAYKFSATVEGPNRLRLLWQIADETYLYNDKIEIRLTEGDGVSLGQYQLPKPKIKQDALRLDGTIGELPVYYSEIDLQIPLLRSNLEPQEITLEVKYQGCADIGLCYPPVTKTIQLSLPAATAISTALKPTIAPVQAANEPVAEQDRLANILTTGSIWLVLAVFFGAGLALSLTPCVFPMIPILSGIIAGHGEKITQSKGFILSLVYVLAMASTYTVIGVAAGLLGSNLQVTFQNPWILSSFAVVFVLLALSMFGFYDLQLPSSLQSKLTEITNKQQSGSLIGVAIMGFLSALIVGPCVAPPLAAALIVIGQTGDWQRGGLSLFALSMGMGTPLLLLGASAGKLLPKAGRWMDAVKAVFGVGLLAVAIVMLERIIPPAFAMALWGLLLITSAIYMGALRILPVEATGWARLWKGLGVAMLVYGALMLVGVAAGGKDTIQPLRGLTMAANAYEASHAVFRPIKTVADLDRELAAASSQGKPVMLDFYADWCVSCKEMERYTFSDPGVIKALDNYILLQADLTAYDDEDKALIEGRFGLPGPPGIIFFDRNGQERRNYRVIGYMSAEEFAAHARQALL
ncbi:Cytochrome c-type biogenesis protein DsbD, protein-disulfide reductase [hydrothermal vent metagenome]|uniref:Thiol:disulfide interchange protein DsbD n=1 Tax=hydrothermal vent metagenome TaxID=652676 RepID=A0A3B1AJX6_9ZZZZ